MAKNNFQYGKWNSYSLQCGMIMTLILPGDCTLQCGMWLWNNMPLNSFLRKSPFCILASRSKMMGLCHIGFRGLVMGSLESPCTTSYRSPIDTIALNCIVFEKIAFFLHFGYKQTDKQTDRQTDGQHRCTKPLSLSRAAA